MTDQLKRALNDAQTDPITQTPARDDEQHFDVSESSYKTSHTAVRKARRFAMQGLYEWLVTDRRFDTTDKRSWKDNAPHDIAARARATNAMHTVHIGYYHEMMRDIPEQIDALDALIAEQLDRGIEKLDTVEHAILLIGAYELQHRLEIPYKVVLDEAMKLNNHFGATDAHKLINAVLDRMAIQLRAVEVQADSKANLRTSQKAASKQAKTSQDEDQSAVQPETYIDTHTDAPTASNKPRISANKTGVKRIRPNNPSAGTATKQASKKLATKPITTSQDTEQDTANTIANIDSKSNPITVADDAVTTTPKDDSMVETDKLLATTDVADIGLENSNLLSDADKTSEPSQDNDNKEASSENNNSENNSSEVKD
nr:transcription antitermination factor NusB [uncultured Psychrobacter sp.]